MSYMLRIHVSCRRDTYLGPCFCSDSFTNGPFAAVINIYLMDPRDERCTIPGQFGNSQNYRLCTHYQRLTRIEEIWAPYTAVTDY